MLRGPILQHAVGLAAQVASALPLLLVAAVLARTVGLEVAGKFTIAAGVGAFAFSPAGWGFRTHILLTRLADFAALDYGVARAAAIAVSSALTIAVGAALGVPILLCAAVALFRACDSMVDLDLALCQIWRSNTYALNRYAASHIAKLVLLAVPLAIALAIRSVDVSALIVDCGIAVCVLEFVVVARDVSRAERGPVTAKKLASLFYQSRWYGSAEIASAGITSAPRIGVAWLYHGAALGVAGISLSVAGFFGMAFYTAWMRFLPAFKAAGPGARRAGSYLAEIIVLALPCAFASIFILPYLASWIFRFHGHADIALSRSILATNVAFFACMSLGNLYKLGSRPWLESVDYAAAVCAAIFAAVMMRDLRNTPATVGIASLVLLAFGLVALARVTREPRAAFAGTPRGLALFARTASRPVPRVARMMQVAAELGYECRYVGAVRDAGLPRNDSWQGWPVQRVGAPFALLNGTRPGTYVTSIIRFNIALYRELLRAHPQLLHASDIETMPAAILYRRFHRTRLIYNIHDNVAQRYNLPGPVNALLNALEGWFVLQSDVSLVPEDFRRDALPRWARRNVATIRNTPIDPGFSPPESPDGCIRIFLAGWLDWGRGLRELLRLVERMPNVELRIAGEGAPAIVEALQGHPRVTFLGYLDYEAVIAETRRCHLVPALYDPARTINRFAASNKIAEALAVGRPILMNCELEISRDLLPYECLLTMPYCDVPKAAQQIDAFFSDTENYRTACRRARDAYDEGYAWETVRAQSRLAILGNAGRTSKPSLVSGASEGPSFGAADREPCS